MGRHIHSKKASWGPGPGAVLLQDTPTTAEHKGGPVGRWAGGRVGPGAVDSRRLACPLQLFCKASTASPSPPGPWATVWGLCGSKCRCRLLALETDLVQGGLVSQGPSLPEREERRAELWVLEEL